ncbi:MAG: universal stress protein [Candidatus Elarobacter sp.]
MTCAAWSSAGSRSGRTRNPPRPQRRRNRRAKLPKRAAPRFGSDTIVIGARDPSGVEALLLGSFADGVVKNAKVPVLVVHHG